MPPARLISFCALMTLPVWAAQAEERADAPALDLSGIERRLDNIEHTLNNQRLLELLQRLDQIRDEIRGVRDEIELQGHALEKLKQEQRRLYTDLDGRLQAMQRQGSPTEADAGNGLARESETDEALPPEIPPAAATTTASEPQPTVTETRRPPPGIADARPVSAPAPEPASPPPPDPALAKSAYDKAFNLLKQRFYDQAAEAFLRYLQDYPQSAFSDNAQYWLAETYYVSKNFEQAIAEYGKLLSDYPQSAKYPHAMLKIGFSHYEAGNVAEAKRFLEQVRRDFPGTSAAQLAEKRLLEIREQAQAAAALP